MSIAHADAGLDRARAIVAAIPDPEIPVINLEELGILRDVERVDGRVRVTITPTYTGCPATQAIQRDVGDALADAGFRDAEVAIVLAPAWSSDWITDEGRRKLREWGIAPPARCADGATESVMRFVPRAGAAPAPQDRGNAPDMPPCPQCGSTHSERLSQYGSTPCKALYRCLSCREPFDYFKPY